MTAKIHSLTEDYKPGRISLYHEASDFPNNWLIKHIMDQINNTAVLLVE